MPARLCPPLCLLHCSREWPHMLPSVPLYAPLDCFISACCKVRIAQTWARHSAGLHKLVLRYDMTCVVCRSLPRIGVHLGVPAQYTQVHWYGRGPHECYPDRQYGAPLRQYSVQNVNEFHVPYMFPSAAPFKFNILLALHVFCQWTISRSALLHAPVCVHCSNFCHVAMKESMDTLSHSLTLQVKMVGGQTQDG